MVRKTKAVDPPIRIVSVDEEDSLRIRTRVERNEQQHSDPIRLFADPEAVFADHNIAFSGTSPEAESGEDEWNSIRNSCCSSFAKSFVPKLTG